MDLYVKLLNHNIAHVTYDAEIAGLRFASFHSWCFISHCCLIKTSISQCSDSMDAVLVHHMRHVSHFFSENLTSTAQ